MVDDYLSRRDKRLEILKAAREERLQQISKSMSQTVLGSSTSSLSSWKSSTTMICLEDHPYYLAQQERKLRALKEKGRASQSDATVNISEEILDELIISYQLIHRQRMYLQHLLQQQQVQQQQELLQLGLNDTTSNDMQGAMKGNRIHQLQSHLIQLQHDKAESEFELRNRLTHNTMRYQERINFLKTKAAYWQTRSQNEVESHKLELQAAQTRMKELEEQLVKERLQQHQQQQEQPRGQDKENDILGHSTLSSTNDEIRNCESNQCDKVGHGHQKGNSHSARTVSEAVTLECLQQRQEQTQQQRRRQSENDIVGRSVISNANEEIANSESHRSEKAVDSCKEGKPNFGWAGIVSKKITLVSSSSSSSLPDLGAKQTVGKQPSSTLAHTNNNNNSNTPASQAELLQHAMKKNRFASFWNRSGGT